MRFLFALIAFSIIGSVCHAQNLVIKEIRFEGLERTKEQLILLVSNLREGRELNVSDTAKVFERAQENLYNTKLFTEVSFQWRLAENNDLIITISVVERWYTYAMPYFDLIDRNFNEWWVVRNHDLSRVIAGADITQKNTSGRNDDISLSFLTGFQQKAKLDYRLPFYLLEGKIGLASGLGLHRYRSVNYGTRNDQLQYESFNDHSLRAYNGYLQIELYPSYLKRRWLEIGLEHRDVNSDILTFNGTYFGALISKLTHGFFAIGYQNDTRNVRGYASEGMLLRAQLKGFHFFGNSQLNFIELKSRMAFHQKITKKFNLAANVGVKHSADKDRPYYLNRGLGWGVNALRNYDYFVIDGHSYIYEKLALRYMAYDKIAFFPKFPLEQFKRVPVKVVPKLYCDLGYVANNLNETGNDFTNQRLISYGAGIDFVFYDDAVWRLEYGRNHAGQASFFLNFTSAIQ